ncbi:MAG TPA: hypothetical protein VJX29_00210 [Candidatus Acidoferrales bacterium]|nr:hypothetical protein [Candidatus Acidoferrales bacterium]
MQVLIGNLQESAGDRHGEQSGNERDGREAVSQFEKTLLGHIPAARDQQENGSDVPSELDPFNWNARDPCGRSHDPKEQKRVRLAGEELRIVRIERRIQEFLEGRKIDGVIFHSTVMTGDQDGRQRQGKLQSERHQTGTKLRLPGFCAGV